LDATRKARKAALKRNEDRYTDTSTGDGVFLRLARRLAGNLNSLSYQRNADYRLLSKVAERHVPAQASRGYRWPQECRAIYH
jgi:hypothetical protein